MEEKKQHTKIHKEINNEFAGIFQKKIEVDVERETRE
jgi:hypothetical protein